MGIRYEHRNGETLTPTVGGHYWIEINSASGGIEPAGWHEQGGWSTRYGGYPVPDEPFRIWGPIPLPNVGENKEQNIVSTVSPPEPTIVVVPVDTERWILKYNQ